LLHFSDSSDKRKENGRRIPKHDASEDIRSRSAKGGGSKVFYLSLDDCHRIVGAGQAHPPNTSICHPVLECYNVLQNTLWRPAKNLRENKTPTAVESAVLIKSARRCPVCFHLDGDLKQKPGQIAHLDGDWTNEAEDNLAWMCMPHHSEYDSTTSQHKNYTIAEIKEMRRRLYEAIATRQHLTASSSQPPAGREADRQTLAALLEVMANSGTMDWLRDANFAGWSFDWSRLDGIERVIMRKCSEHEFIDPELEKPRKKYYDACNANHVGGCASFLYCLFKTLRLFTFPFYDQLVRTAKKRLLS
jgi:hypothetical protein